MGFFNPYFTAVLGTSLAFSGIVAIFQRYGLRIISSPIGGYLGDKVGSTAKIIRISMCVLGLLVLLVMFLPAATPLAVLVTIVFIIGLFNLMNLSLQSSIAKDAMVPPKNHGLVVGMTSLFTAELFQHTLFGTWLDDYGKDGYTYIWIYTLCTIVLGVVVLTLMINRRKRIEGELK
jgi:hypothetical protein